MVNPLLVVSGILTKVGDLASFRRIYTDSPDGLQLSRHNRGTVNNILNELDAFISVNQEETYKSRSRSTIQAEDPIM